MTDSLSLHRTTFNPNRRLQRVLVHLEQQDLQHRMEPGDILPVLRTWRRRRGLALNEFRMSVYSQNLWVTTLPSVGQPRDLSPQNFRYVLMILSLALGRVCVLFCY